MRWQWVIICLISIFPLIQKTESSEDKKEPQVEKKYTEEEFEVAVKDRLNEILKKIRTEKMSDFSKSLLEKEKRLQMQEEAMMLKKKDLDKIEESLSKRVKEINSRQTKIIGCLEKNDKSKANRINHLVQIVSGMKPKNAAEMLSVQESKLTVEIISKLDPVKVSKIFNLMDKEISSRLQKEYLNMQK